MYTVKSLCAVTIASGNARGGGSVEHSCTLHKCKLPQCPHVLPLRCSVLVSTVSPYSLTERCNTIVILFKISVLANGISRGWVAILNHWLVESLACMPKASKANGKESRIRVDCSGNCKVSRVPITTQITIGNGSTCQAIGHQANFYYTIHWTVYVPSFVDITISAPHVQYVPVCAVI